MDQLNLNIRQRWWLDVMMDYDCEILYHLERANVMPDSLSRKAVMTLIRDIYMRMKVIAPLLEQIQEARFEAIKEDHRKSERILVQVASFDFDI